MPDWRRQAAVDRSVRCGRRLVVLRRLRRDRAQRRSDHELAALLVFAAATALLAMLLAPRSTGRGSTGSASTLWPIAALARCHRAARATRIPPKIRLARLAGRRRRDALVPARARGAVPAARRRAARDGLLARRGARRVGTHWLVDRAADGVWPEAAVLALGAALVLATLRATHGRRLAVRGARAHLRVSRLRRRARGARRSRRSR